MLQFFIELYESIIYIYNHLDPESNSTPTSIETPTHHIITINEDTLPYVTYETMMNNTPYSLKHLVADVSAQAMTRNSSPIHGHERNQDVTLEIMSSTLFHDVRLQESIMAEHKILDDYCLVPQPSDRNDEWEIL